MNQEQREACIVRPEEGEILLRWERRAPGGRSDDTQKEEDECLNHLLDGGKV